MNAVPSRWRRWTVKLAQHAAWVLPGARSPWADAMRRELDYIADDPAALRWALGCVLASYRARLTHRPCLRAPAAWRRVATSGALMLLIGLALQGNAGGQTESPQPAFDETTCDLSGVAPELRPRLRCGTVSVPRSYDDPDAGRFILVDQRGTGRSEPSLCPDLERKLLETTLALVAGVTEQALAPAPGRLFGLPRSGDQPRLRSEGFRNKGNGRGFRLGEGYQSP